jgi:hypothetical protein
MYISILFEKNCRPYRFAAAAIFPQPHLTITKSGLARKQNSFLHKMSGNDFEIGTSVIRSYFYGSMIRSQPTLYHRIHDGLLRLPSGRRSLLGLTPQKTYLNLRRLPIILSLTQILSTVEMESKDEFWSERYTLNLPPDISRDNSELDYLRRTNMEAAAEAPKPQLKQVYARKLRPLIIFQPTLSALSAEFFGQPTTPRRIIRDETPETGVHLAEETRRDSGVVMEDEEKDEIEIQSPNHSRSSANCTDECRRDSGIAMDNENEYPYRSQGLAGTCCCDSNHQDVEQVLVFEDDIGDRLPIDEAFVGFVI